MNSSSNRKVLINYAALVVLGILIQIGAAYLLNGILWGFESLEELNSRYTEITESLTDLSTRMLLYTVVIAPLIEELVFRVLFIGALGKMFRELYKGKIMKQDYSDKYILFILISSVLFGLYHGNVVQFVYAFILGIVLGYVYQFRGGYVSAVILHMSINISGQFIVNVLPVYDSALIMGIIGITVLIITAFLWLLYIKTEKKTFDSTEL